METCTFLRALKPSWIIRSVRRSSPTFRAASIHTGSEKLVKKAYDGLLLDAGGTLLQLNKPVEDIYAQIGRSYGLQITPAEIKDGFKRAFTAPWPEKLRYQGDGKPFWKLVVSEATGCNSDDYFEEVYEYYAHGDAWHLPVGALETISVLKDAGVKLAVVSNFDSRLRKLLKDLNVLHLFDAVIISSEVGHEKPDPKIFGAALDLISVEAGRAIHVGDDQKSDKEGASAVGIDCWVHDIILAEVDLLKANDWQTLRYITCHKEMQHIPVIILTTRDQVSVSISGLKLGAVDYLLKSIQWRSHTCGE